MMAFENKLFNQPTIRNQEMDSEFITLALQKFLRQNNCVLESGAIDEDKMSDLINKSLEEKGVIELPDGIILEPDWVDEEEGLEYFFVIQDGKVIGNFGWYIG